MTRRGTRSRKTSRIAQTDQGRRRWRLLPFFFLRRKEPLASSDLSFSPFGFYLGFGFPVLDFGFPRGPSHPPVQADKIERRRRAGPPSGKIGHFRITIIPSAARVNDFRRCMRHFANETLRSGARFDAPVNAAIRWTETRTYRLSASRGYTRRGLGDRMGLPGCLAALAWAGTLYARRLPER